jgi:hypothetical protein
MALDLRQVTGHDYGRVYSKWKPEHFTTWHVTKYPKLHVIPKLGAIY